MSDVLLEHMLDCYHGDGVFSLNNIEVKMGLKGVALI